MPVTTRPRLVSFALKTLSSAVACAVLLSPAAYAAGLGKLTVLSALGQPLRAEIELTAVSADEASGLVAKLAPAEAFRLANIEFNPALLSLRFEVEQRNGRQFIRISSSQAVNEPFVDMLLELNWTGGRLVREYTFLLDPAELRSTQSPQVAAPVEAPARAAPAAPRPTPAASRPASAAAPAPAPAPAPARPAPAASSEYAVRGGDNLTRIAARIKPVDVSLDMMLVALYRANPEAFAGNNMNRLKSGRILAVPETEAIRSGGVAPAEAREIVVAHAADFSAYRSKLAGQVATSAPAKEPEASQNSAGKISAKVEEKATAANAAKDQLKLSKAAPAAATQGQTAVAGVEDKIAQEKQLAEAADRVRQLEKNVIDLEQLMAVKAKAMAEQQKAEAASASASASVPASASASASAVVKTKPAKPPVVPRRIAEPSLFETLMGYRNELGLGLATLLAGAGALLVARRRKAKPAEAAPLEPAVDNVAGQAQSLIDQAGGQSVDTSNSVFNSNFAPSASQLDTNEVDPVAEADVYIAYGRDAQAEEILKEALRTHPDRLAARVKLLEIYASRKDPRAFEAQVRELHEYTRGQGEEWAQAIALGKTIDAFNPLYVMAESSSPAVAEADSAEARAAALDLDLDQDAGAIADTLDFGLDRDAGVAANTLDFGLDQALDTALPQAPTAAEVAADADSLLDFDMGGLDQAVLPAAPAATEEPMLDLAFDLPEAAPAASPAAAQPDIDFGFELPEAVKAAEVAEAVEAVEPAPAPELDDPLADLDMMDFDLPSRPAPAEVAAQAGIELEDMLQAPAAPAAPADTQPDTSLPEFDLSSIDLDLAPAAAAAELADAAEPAEAAPAPADSAAEPMSAQHMEMDTKLDLAVAYQEIGDKEGARELLDEVLRGGSDEQVARANAMRAQLG